MIFMILGVEVGSQNRSKIDQKMESKMECILASIFYRFWWILGSKLGGKMEACWHQNLIENRALRKYEKTHLELAR